MKPILVLGLGNPLRGDDGVGCAVIQELARFSLPDSVEVMEGGTPGVGLLNLLQDRRHVIIVDAAEMGRAAGEWVRFSPEQVDLTVAARSLSLHAAGVAEAMALGDALRLPIPGVTIYGIQPECVDWGEGLSPLVLAVVPQVAEAITGQASILSSSAASDELVGNEADRLP